MVELPAIRQLSELRNARETFANDVRAGLTADPKWFPCKYLYDKDGSDLFEQIVQDPLFYLYHAETEILRSNATEILRNARPDEVVELGSGTSTKTRLLLEAMQATGCHRYVPLEIAESTLRKAVAEISAEFVWLRVDGYVGDFNTDLHKVPRNGRRLLVFLGSTVGNFRSKVERMEFFKRLSATMEEGDSLLLGVDLMKEVESNGYTNKKELRKRFYMRSLEIMNSELGANFDGRNFKSQCMWNQSTSTYNVSLVSQNNQTVTVRDLQLEIAF